MNLFYGIMQNVQPCNHTKFNSTNQLGVPYSRNSLAQEKITQWLTKECIMTEVGNEAS